MAEREPTLGEVADDVREVKEDIKGLRAWMDGRFLPREVYDAHQETRSADKKYIEAEIGRIEAQQRAKEAVLRTWLLALTAGLICPLAVALVLWAVKGTP